MDPEFVTNNKLKAEMAASLFQFAFAMDQAMHELLVHMMCRGQDTGYTTFQTTNGRKVAVALFVGDDAVNKIESKIQ